MDQTYQREQAIFEAALELPPEQRVAHLESACGADAELRRRVLKLLDASGQTSDYLDDPPARRGLAGSVVVEKAGDSIGRYKLLQQIGQGGCGVVYMAEQVEPVRRRVALKIIKLGMDTKSVIARFEAERQALALMDHPNIAKVFDAGATETGRPYFVMELVRGTKITEFCDERRLSTRQRLDLFIRVCHAVQHAHQKGIIHRDIKPSNILVSEDDGVMVPKVIDFGIAKVTGGQLLTDKTVFTAFEQFIGTPAYMSPEQALVTNADIDTRSDIYALGVLLYELLTGRTPFETDELLKVGLDEMCRTIREQEPPRPSTRLSTLSGLELSTAAQLRGLEAPKLLSQVRGDLDWVIMKALEKDRARRYETANGVAMDIQRHLNSEPVVACPPGRLYRFRKFVRRNKLAFAAGSAVAASLVIGLSLSTVLFFREWAARKQANEQAAIARAVTVFLQVDLLQQADSDAQVRAGFKPNPNLTVREALDRAATRIGDRFKDQPSQEGAVRHLIGMTLRSLGEAEKAIPHLQRALELSRVSNGPEHVNTLLSMKSLAIAFVDTGKLDQALPLLEEALKITKAALGPDDPLTLNVMGELASAYRHAGKADRAFPLYERALKLMTATLGPDNSLTLNTLNNLAVACAAADKRDQALSLFEDALRRMKATLRPDDGSIPRAMNNLATLYRETGKLDLALSLAQEALKRQRANLPPDHPETLGTMDNLAITYREAGKLDMAISLHEETLELRKVKLGSDDRHTLHSMCNLASAYREAGKLDLALPLFEETLERMKVKLGPDDQDTLSTMDNLAIAYQRAGKLDMAIFLHDEALKLRKLKLRPDHRDTLRSMNNLANAWRQAGLIDQALPLFEETLRLQKTTLGPDDRETIGTMCNLVLTYGQSGRVDQTLPLAEETFKLAKAKLSPDDPLTRTATDQLAVEYGLAAKWEQALPLFEESLKMAKARLRPDHPDTLRMMENLAVTYVNAGKMDQALPLVQETLKVRNARYEPDHPDTLRTMAILADLLARQGKLKEAAEGFNRLIQSNPSNHWDWYVYAALLAFTDRKAELDEHCREFFKRFVQSQDPDVIERAVKSALLLPLSPENTRTAVELADELDPQLIRGPQGGWIALVKGLAEYRNRNFEAAIEYLLQASKDTRPPSCQAQAFAISAMAYYQLKQIDQAHSVLSRAKELERLQNDFWHDRLRVLLLVREASALIEGRSESK